ncbi:unnamed protein product [Rotaria socialis]|uniref:Uncharacterized protein n=1 Tax=Rotaria socialis TaxID=392032 RepID=A0A820RZB4_9BILA|nr:unnamed protein product [Rotaria socialis]
MQIVWDLIEHTLLACVRSKVHKIRGDLQAVCYNSHTRCLLFASEQISFLNLKLRPYLHADVVVSHYEPILGLLFIKEFKQVISCTESGVIRLWDFLTGRQVHEFRAHNGQAVTSMTLDTTERRLITGSRDGTCRVWNVHNGQLLKIFKKPNDSLEVTDVAFILVNNNCSILSVGWDKRVNVFKDDRERIKQVCYPEDQFMGDSQNEGHKEDILCIDKSQGDLIATGDYGGKIIIWNMSSKKIFACLKDLSAENQHSEALDWTIRLWNLQGHFIGTFGQTIPWNLYDPATYQHPSVPLDVLTDPKSLPHNQQIKDEKDDASPPVPTIVINKQAVLDDETIANNVHDTINKLRHSQSAGGFVGKRLRYFRDKPAVSIRRDGSSHYQHLRFYPIDDNPPVQTASSIVHFANTVKL